MKKSLSLLLAIALVFGMFSGLAFAAEKTPGQLLNEAGVILGNGTDLKEDQTWKRQDMAVLMSRLFGVEADAKATAKDHTFADVTNKDYDGYITWAVEQGLMKGHSTTKFGYDQELTAQQFATVLLRVFGIDNFKEAVEIAIEEGYLPEGTEATDKITRGVTYEGIVNALNTEVADGKTLGEILELPGFVKVEAPAVSLKVDAVNALTSTIVKLSLSSAATEADVAAAVSKISIVDSAKTAVTVSGAVLTGEKEVRLTTSATKAKTKYTLTYEGQEFDYIGMDADTAGPEVAATAVAKTNNTVELTFNEELDKVSAMTVANYSINNDLVVTGASVDGNKVTLTTSDMTAGKLYTVTVGAVKDLSGNTVKSDKNKSNFGGIAKVTGALKVLTTAITKNNIKVQVIFEREVDKATAENPANYTVDKGLTVTAASVVSTDDDATYGKRSVYLTTSSQTAGDLYTVTVAGVKDTSGNLVGSSDNTAKFGGVAKDTTGVEVSATAITRGNGAVEVFFNEQVDKATAEVVANYTIDNNLTITKAELQSSKMSVKLTTSAQTAGQLYTIKVANVTDIFANVVKSDKNTAKFGGVALDTTGASVSRAYATVESGVSYVYVEFNKEVDEKSAEIAANYAFDKDLGYGLSAELQAGNKIVKVKTHDQSFNTLYKVTVSKVLTVDKVVVKSDANSATFAGVGADLKPVLNAALAKNIRAVVLYFNTTLTSGVGTGANNAANYSVKLGAGPNLVQTAVYNNDDKTVTLYLNADLAQGSLYDVVVNLAVVNARGTAQTEATKMSTQFAGVANAADFNIDYIMAVDNKTIDVYFNDVINPAKVPVTSEVFIKGGVSGADDAAFQNYTASLFTVSTTSNNKVVRLTLTAAANKFVAGRVYTIKINDAADLTNLIQSVGGVTVKYNTASETSEFQFAGSPVANEKAAIDYVIAQDKKVLKVVFKQPVNNFTNSAGDKAATTLIAITASDTNFATAKAAQDIKPVAGTDNKEFLIYFVDAMTSGNVYELSLGTAVDVRTIANSSASTQTETLKGTVAGSAADHARPVIASVDVDNARTVLTVKFNQPVTTTATNANDIFVIEGTFQDGTAAVIPASAFTNAADADTVTVTLAKALKGGTIGKLGLVAGGNVADRTTTVNEATAAGDRVQFSVPVDTAAPAAPAISATSVTAAGGSITVTFAELLSDASKTAVQTAISTGVGGVAASDLTYSWTNSVLTITNNHATVAATWAADATVNVTDLFGNTATVSLNLN